MAVHNIEKECSSCLTAVSVRMSPGMIVWYCFLCLAVSDKLNKISCQNSDSLSNYQCQTNQNHNKTSQDEWNWKFRGFMVIILYIYISQRFPITSLNCSIRDLWRCSYVATVFNPPSLDALGEIVHEGGGFVCSLAGRLHILFTMSRCINCMIMISETNVVCLYSRTEPRLS